MKDYEYFTDINNENIIIEEREYDYCVWLNNSIVKDGLSIEESLKLANELLLEQ